MSTYSQQIKRDADDLAEKRLLEYVWVISLKRFVKINDPTNPDHTLDADQFNEAFDLFSDQLGMSPEDYIRRRNKQHRVMARLEMLPGVKEKIAPLPDEAPLKALNLSAPIPEPPYPGGPPGGVESFPSILFQHLVYLFDNDQDNVHHFLKWLAHLVFVPQTRMNHGIMISGKYGTGKSWLGLVIKGLIGENSFEETSVDKLKGSFDGFIAGKRCFLVEEVTQGNSANFYNSIKTYFTSPKIQVNPKFINVYSIKNHTHWILLSNSTKPVVLDAGDRRIFYVHSKATRRNDSYYDQLFDTLPTELAKIYWFLKNNFLSMLEPNFAVHPPIKTADHQKLAFASENDLKLLIEDELASEAGYFKKGVFFKWLDFKVHMDLLCKSNSIKCSDLKEQLIPFGVTHKRVTIEGRKLSIAWFPSGNADLPKLFQDTSTAGRQTVKDKFYADSRVDFTRQRIYDPASAVL